LGYNYRIDEMRSALGLVQLSKLDKNNKRRKTITQTYWGALGGSRLGLPFREYSAQPVNSGSYHIFPVLLPEGVARKDFMDSLRAAGIQTSIHYPPIHQFSYHRRLLSGVALPQTERVAEREVTLPLYSSMSESQVELVLEAVKGVLEGARAG
jgi:dTDP-4-amino-4,6-dideoxygalactose transaminase